MRADQEMGEYDTTGISNSRGSRSPTMIKRYEDEFMTIFVSAPTPVNKTAQRNSAKLGDKPSRNAADDNEEDEEACFKLVKDCDDRDDDWFADDFRTSQLPTMDLGIAAAVATTPGAPKMDARESRARTRRLLAKSSGLRLTSLAKRRSFHSSEAGASGQGFLAPHFSSASLFSMTRLDSFASRKGQGLNAASGKQKLDNPARDCNTDEDAESPARESDDNNSLIAIGKHSRVQSDEDFDGESQAWAEMAGYLESRRCDEASARLIVSVCAEVESAISRETPAPIPQGSGGDRAAKLGRLGFPSVRVLSGLFEAIRGRFRASKPSQPRKAVVARTLKLDHESFCGESVPKIELHKFLFRIVRYLNEYHPETNKGNRHPLESFGMRCLSLANVYVSRFRRLNPGFALTHANVHRLFLASVLIAAKYAEDEHPSNEYLAIVGGIDLDEMNHLENVFCSAMKFQFYVSPEEGKDAFGGGSDSSSALPPSSGALALS